MNIPAGSDETAAVMAQMRALAAGTPEPPMDADFTAALPRMQEAAGQWVNTSGRSAAEAGITLYIHGGGFAHTEPLMERLMAGHLSKATGRPVFAVDYRLAPAHPYPAALDDVTAVYSRLLDQGVPESRIVLFGESAGGTLALSALLALKESAAPMPAAVIAVSPLTDLTLSSPSLDTNDERDMINRAVLKGVTTQYLAGARPDLAPQSPLYGYLRGLPALLLIAGSAEVLLDDARRFAAAASAAGTAVTLDVYEGMPHVFHLAMLPGVPLPTTTTFLRRLAEWTEERQR
ncbi:alpha/beta hydrolase fold domain-containing protein [Nonomuraea sp. NPDC050022]|uniref:alpha/beta hydrolase fold domain-containing protein n=1 Tax=unclassified Nonomuraea TaxID=2593643 RepID=UPI0033FFB221